MKTPNLLTSGTATINMTPMIDVVFLLIIFFLVSSHLAKQENSIKLDLPEAVSALDDSAVGDTLIVNILPSGTWQVGGVDATEGTLPSIMRRRQMSASGPLRLKIRTDRRVTYDAIEPVLRIAAAAGIGDIVFSVYEDRQG